MRRVTDETRLSDYDDVRYAPSYLHQQKSTNNRLRRGACIICRINRNEEKHNSTKTYNQSVKRVMSYCVHCEVFLCKDHFDTFHDIEDVIDSYINTAIISENHATFSEAV